jgi:hypothetical protein
MNAGLEPQLLEHKIAQETDKFCQWMSTLNNSIILATYIDVLVWNTRSVMNVKGCDGKWVWYLGVLIHPVTAVKIL